jgi:hypothetical protein
MYSKDVLSLKETIDPEIKNKISAFEKANPKCSDSIKAMNEILSFIKNVPAIVLDEDGNVDPGVEINVERSFGYSTGIFDLLCEKVRELILMMRNADTDEYSPLSIGNIQNVGMSLFRRVFFIANEKTIRKKSNGQIIYPFIIVDPALKHIMYNLFLTIYFSPICDFLVPLYVYSAIPLCQKKNVVRFNVRHPVEGIRDDALDQYHLYGGVFKLKSNNPPGSVPYKYQEIQPSEDKK